MNLVRTIRWPVGRWRGSPNGWIPGGYETGQVGIRADALTDEECEHCWGTGRRVRGWRSHSCETGTHTGGCIGNTQPGECICWCHQEVADRRAALVVAALKQEPPA